jgi:hypothetical protein
LYWRLLWRVGLLCLREWADGVEAPAAALRH